MVKPIFINKQKGQEKALIINSVKNRKNIKLNLVNIIERNNIIKRNLNNNDINKKNNSIRTSSKLKLSINDDFPLMENNSGCSEFKLLNSKKDKNDVKIKIYKYNDKCLTKKSANKKKNCYCFLYYFEYYRRYMLFFL